MKDQEKTKQQLIEELTTCRRRLAEVQGADALPRNAEEALRRNERRYHTMAEASPDMIFVIGRDDKVRYVNPRAAERFGVDPDEIVGARREALFPPQISESQREGLHRVLQSGEKLNVESRVPFPDSEAWLSTWLVPISDDDDGEVRAVLGMARDVTERKEAERALKERVKELACLYAVHRDMQRDLSPDELCRRIVEHLIPAMQFPEFIVPVVELDGERFTTDDQSEAVGQGLRATVEVKGDPRGSVSVHYTDGRPFLLPQEQSLIDNIAETLGLWLERHETGDELRRHRDELEDLVSERTHTIQQQTEEILELSTPVMEVMESVIVVPLIGMLDSGRAQRFTDVLLRRVADTDAAVALVDITGVPTIDTQTAQHLIEAVDAVRLLGARVVLTGVRPAIAQSLVHLGIDLSDLTTRSSLAAGLRVAQEMVE
jgi:PAS domain S-box-containing protein